MRTGLLKHAAVENEFIILLYDIRNGVEFQEESHLPRWVYWRKKIDIE